MKYTSKTVRKLVCLMAGLAFAATVATVLAFYAEFRTEPIQHDSGAWANFGSYVGGVLSAIVAVINLAALLLIALVVTDQQQNALAAKRLALDMLAQWNAAELHQSRRVVSDLIENAASASAIPTLRELELARTDESLHAFRLYHFFEQWAVLNSISEIDHRILATAIGSRTLWYQTHFFSPIRAREQNADILKTLEIIEVHLFQRLLTPGNDA